MRLVVRGVFAALLSFVFASAAMAVPAFDNFGENFSYEGSTGVLVSGAAGTFGHRSAALQFTATQSGKLAQLTLPLSAKDGGRPNDGLRLTLLDDDGNQPGAALESVVLNNICYVNNECEQGQLYTAMAGGTTEIDAGSTYWLLASSDLEAAEFTWYLTTETDPALVAIFNGLTGIFVFATPPALFIGVTSANGGGEVPEPVSLLFAPIVAWSIRRAIVSR